MARTVYRRQYHFDISVRLPSDFVAASTHRTATWTSALVLKSWPGKRLLSWKIYDLVDEVDERVHSQTSSRLQRKAERKVLRKREREREVEVEGGVDKKLGRL